MKSLKQIAYLIKKDITFQLRTKDAVILVFIFSLLVVLVFCFVFGPIFVPASLGIDARRAELSKLAGSVLWIAFTFSSIIGLNRSFEMENSSGSGLNGLWLTGITPSSLYLSKVISNTLLLFFINLIITPIALIFLNVFDFISLFNFLKLIAVIALGTLGFSAGGTLFAYMSSSARGHESLLSVILFPMLFPLIIAASKSSVAVLSDKPLMEGRWFVWLVAYGLIVSAVSYLLFEYVVE